MYGKLEIASVPQHIREDELFFGSHQMIHIYTIKSNFFGKYLKEELIATNNYERLLAGRGFEAVFSNSASDVFCEYGILFGQILLDGSLKEFL